MKKWTLLILAVFVVASVFAGCSASAYMDDPYRNGYSNVSTTRNGTVNGTNGRYAGYNYGYDNYQNGAYPGTYNGNSAGTYNGNTNGVYDSTTGTTRNATTTGTNRTGSYTGTTSGTGMVGGR